MVLLQFLIILSQTIIETQDKKIVIQEGVLSIFCIFLQRVSFLYRFSIAFFTWSSALTSNCRSMNSFLTEFFRQYVLIYACIDL